MIHRILKRRLAIGTVALAAVAFAGGAYAATQDSTAQVRQAFLNDVAKRLKVTPQQLSAALQGAFFDQLTAAVTAGKLTQPQADAIKQRAQKLGGSRFFGGPGLFDGPPPFGPPRLYGGPPPFGAPRFGAPRVFGGPPPPGGLRPFVPRFFGGPRFFGRGIGPVPAAAKYLGLSPIQLLDQLGSGKSLAQIAKSRSKSIAGLKAAMAAAERTQLDLARQAKIITSAQQQQILSRLSARLDRQIKRSGFARRGFFRLRGRGERPGAPDAGPGPPGERPAAPGKLPALPALPGGIQALPSPPAPASPPVGATGPAY